ncbi:MAG: ferritin [Actinomycetota bacterium]
MAKKITKLEKRGGALEKTMEAALNDQLNEELRASYVYLGMAAHCESHSLPGFGQWLWQQSREEYDHAMRFYRFILDRNAAVTLKDLGAPPTEYESVLALVEEALEHERMVTRSIYDLYTLANEQGDYASLTLLHQFAAEQVEEEKSLTDIIDTLNLVGAVGAGMFMLDRELGKRVGATALGEPPAGSGG